MPKIGSLERLVQSNKEEILRDQMVIRAIEERVEKRLDKQGLIDREGNGR